MQKKRLDERLKATSDHTVDSALARLTIEDYCIALAELGCMGKTSRQWKNWLQREMLRIGMSFYPTLSEVVAFAIIDHNDMSGPLLYMLLINPIFMVQKERAAKKNEHTLCDQGKSVRTVQSDHSR